MIELPQAYLEMPRWWQGGQDWLAALPGLVEHQLDAWRLSMDGPVMHGSNALVVPVRRDSVPLALRLTPPDESVAAEVAALEFWAGRGTVQLVAADVAAGATLLERLDGSGSAAALPLETAVPVLGKMMRRLAVPAPLQTPSTADLARQRRSDAEAGWQRHGRPFSARVLRVALDAADALSSTDSDLAVNGDLHYEQVLRGTREPWLCVDPVLLRGDIEYDLARILWMRLDEMADAAEVRRHFDTMVAEAGLERDRAATWVLLRTVDYWLWGLDHGLTEDPVRCARLADIFLP